MKKRRRCEENEKVIDLTLSGVFKKTVKLKRTPEEMKNNIIFLFQHNTERRGRKCNFGQL